MDFNWWSNKTVWTVTGCIFSWCFPAVVPEAEGHWHARGHGHRGHASMVRKRRSTLPPALLFILIPPLFGLLFPDQLGGPQCVSQQLTDVLGLLMSTFDSCRAGALPKVQTHGVNIRRKLIVRKLWIWLRTYLPHLTEASYAVVELRRSHTHAPVQLLQQEATHTLHYLKIREMNQDLWGGGGNTGIRCNTCTAASAKGL